MTTASLPETAPQALVWDIKVPYSRMKRTLIRAGMVIGLPFGALILFLLYGYFVHGEAGGLYGAVMILIILALVPPVMWLVYGGAYELHVEMSDAGIVCENSPKQANRTSWVAFFIIILNLLAKQRSHGAMSAACAGTSRIRTDIAWKNIKAVTCKPKTREIIIREKYMRHTDVYCTEENYETVVQFMADRLPSSVFKK